MTNKIAISGVKEDVAYLAAQEFIYTNRQVTETYWNQAITEEDVPNDINALLDQPIGADYHNTDQLGSAHIEIKDERYDQLKNFAQKHDITLNVIVQFVWHKVLQTYSNHTKSIVGTVVSGRDLPVEGIGESVGLYINTLPLLVGWDNSNTTIEQLQHIQTQLTDLNEHASGDLAKIQGEGGRLFHSLLVFENYPDLKEDDSQKITYRGVLEKVNYPISVLAYNRGGQLIIRLRFDQQVLSQEKAEQHLDLFNRLLLQMPDKAENAHSELAILDTAEYNKIVKDWNQTASTLPDLNVIGLFQQHVEKTPDAIALSMGETRFSYQQVDQLSDQLVVNINRKYEAQHGKRLVPGTVIALYMDRSPELIISQLAIMKTGGVYLPMDPAHPAERINFMLKDSEAAMVLCGEANDVKDLTAENYLKVKISELEDHPFEENKSAYTPSQEDTAYIIYTSGTTGEPKGVLVNHENLLNLALGIQSNLGLDEHTIASQLISISFDAAVAEIVPVLISGGQLSILSDTDKQSDRLLTAAGRERITCLTIPADLLESLDYTHLPDLKVIHVGGGVISTDCLEKWIRNVAVFNGYGPTETTVCSTMNRFDPSDANVNIGKPLDNVQVFVLDALRNPVPVGVQGELYIGGKGVAKGYLNRPELTNQRFVDNPFTGDVDSSPLLYKTGDIVKWLPDGSLRFYGRNDDQVKILGYRIELTEIEQALTDLPGIKQACVLVKERVTENATLKYLLGYVVFDDDTLTEEKAMQQLEETLPAYMVPSALIRMEEMPLTINGKIDKKKLPDQATNLLIVSPQSDLEKSLCGIYAKILGLNIEEIGIHDNFFKLGGNSILAVRLKQKLNELPEFTTLSIADIFTYNTVSKLIESNSSKESTHYNFQKNSGEPGNHEIAIIGMSGAYSGADSIAELWELIVNQKEGLRIYTEQECLDSGIPEHLVQKENFVPVSGKIGHVESFDPAFWGMSPNEAKQLDPQIRKFVEHSWWALEQSGYANKRADYHIGTFAGSGDARYFHDNVVNGEMAGEVNLWEASISNSKDALATKTAYMMNLSGPAKSINTACSTGLVSIVEACKNLHVGTCDMALAGGVAFSMPDDIGYMHEEGMIFSKDGHCRTFDKDASGTISGSGVGVVVLKRLDEAIKDNDHIYGVIKGYATNNDGARKSSYTAPSVIGQTECILNAQKMAGITSDQVDFVECHGTATNLGDPIEVQALKEAFEYNKNGQKNDHPKTVLGAIKANIGHTGSAAGVAGLMKVCAMLAHDVIPGQVNFEAPNPELHLTNSVFEVSKHNKSWQAETDSQRLAGVSSFGIGGTNAHVIIGDYLPQNQVKSQKKRDTEQSAYVIPVSAKSRKSLEQYKKELKTLVSSENSPAIADIAYSLQNHRNLFDFRESYVAKNHLELIAKLDKETVFTEVDSQISQHVVLMFPGQGGQYRTMAKGLYDREPAFAQIIDDCVSIANKYLDADLKEVLFDESSKEDINAIKWTPVSLFVVEYSLAKYIEMLGVTSDAYIGHSFGEFAAATMAGVFSLEDGIRAVITRGRLMQEMQEGHMIAINATEEVVRELIAEFDCELSVVNSPEDVVASGKVEDIDRLLSALEQRGIPVVKINSLVAGHSKYMEKAAEKFSEFFNKITLNKPAKVFISNLTGKPAGEEVTSGAYWCRQLRNTVQFSSGIRYLLDSYHSRVAFVEVGPGKGLSYFVNKQKTAFTKKSVQTIQMLPAAKEILADTSSAELTGKDIIARLWAGNVISEPNASADFMHSGYVSALPVYQFEKKKCWIEKVNSIVSFSGQKFLIEQFTEQLNEMSVLTKEEAVRLLERLIIPATRKEANTAESNFQLIEEHYSDEEEVIAKCISAVLGVDELSIYDDFFKIGGNSILAIKLSHELSKALQTDVKVAEIFQHKTTSKLAGALQTTELDVENVVKDF
ncbi:MAG: amino acid adenylation domain-containing protein [Cyclobacteriaceae bacterium]